MQIVFHSLAKTEAPVMTWRTTLYVNVRKAIMGKCVRYCIMHVTVRLVKTVHDASRDRLKIISLAIVLMAIQVRKTHDTHFMQVMHQDAILNWTGHFSGKFCEIDIDNCADDACPPGHICKDMVDSYECHCPPGFAGDRCSVNIDDCASSPCMNGGTCKDGIQNYTCSCHSGRKLDIISLE